MRSRKASCSCACWPSAASARDARQGPGWLVPRQTGHGRLARAWAPGLQRGLPSTPRSGFARGRSRPFFRRRPARAPEHAEERLRAGTLHRARGRGAHEDSTRRFARGAAAPAIERSPTRGGSTTTLRTSRRRARDRAQAPPEADPRRRFARAAAVASPRAALGGPRGPRGRPPSTIDERGLGPDRSDARHALMGAHGRPSRRESRALATNEPGTVLARRRRP